MSEFKFACPHCDQHLQCDECLMGTEIECPSCRKVIVVPQSPRLLETSPGFGRALVPPFSEVDATDAPTVHDATLSFSVATVKGEVRPVITAAGQEEIRAAFGPGRVLQDRYVLERELGRGGMGQVYLALDKRLSRHVAVKVMLPTVLGEQGDPNTPATSALHEAFAEEARRGANLTHPAIAPVFDFGFHEGKPFTVFEYIPGETLQDLLRRRKRLPLDDVRLILAPLAQALDFAHSQHVVHRDLKPANIRATPQGQFKILDLGLAKEFRRRVDWAAFAGTPAYASPEQAAGLASDGRTDQYALALIAYEMLTGQRAFQSRDPMELLRMHREQEPPAPQTVASELPEPVCGALLRALQKDADRRFATVGQFAAAMGSQFLSPTSPSAEILLEADVDSRPSILFRVFSRLVASFIDLRLSSPTRRLHLILTDDALWCDRRGEIVRWPIESISKVARMGRWNDELIIVSPRTDGATRQHLRFFTIAECEKWHERICSLKKTLDSAAPKQSPEPFQKPIILLRRQPLMRYQILSSMESTRYTRWSAEAALRVRAAMIGADAVVAAHEERLTNFRGEKRRSGTAIKAVDQSGLFELRLHWFNERVQRTTAMMIWMLATNFILVVWLSDLTAKFVESALVQFFALSHTWPLFMALLLRILKWPQLAPAIAASSLAFATQLVPLSVGALIAATNSTGGPEAILYSIAALPGGLAGGALGVVFFLQARRDFRQVSSGVSKADQRSAPLRTTMARLATIASLGVALFLAARAYYSVTKLVALHRWWPL